MVLCYTFSRSEKVGYRSENAMLMDKLAQVWENCKELHKECGLDCRMSADNNYQVRKNNFLISCVFNSNFVFQGRNGWATK